jgi:uncharacterized repeat protein (TIGR01451 family)
MKPWDARVISSRSYTRFDPRKSVVGRALTILFVAAVLLSVSGIPALAISNTTPFELDRNAVKQINDDWNNVLGFGVPASGSDIGHTFVPDSPATDTTYFAGGGSKDIYPISRWAYDAAGAQDKDEITNAYAAAYVVNSNIQLYFGDDRFATSGNATMGFWFLQNTVTTSGGKFTGAHKVGDILIVSDFPSTGAVSTIKVFKWNGSGITEITPTGGSDCITAPATAPICATVNQTATTAPWPYTPKAGTPGTFPPGSFLEGGVNLNSLFPTGTQVPCFASFLAETRASNSANSTLSDFALGGINTCGEVKGTKFNDLNVNHQRDAGEPGLQGWTITATGTTSGGQAFTTSTTTAADGTYTLADIPPGTYTICETLQTGWNQSLPQSGASCTSGGATFGYSVTLGLGQIVTGKDFGNYQNAHLTISKTADKTTVNAGDQIGFTVTLTNTGTGTATGVTLSDTLPSAPGVTWSLDTAGSIIPSGISCAVTTGSPQSLTCGATPSTNGPFNLAAGATLKLHVTSPTSSATCASNTLTNTASFTSQNGGSGSSASVTITVNCPSLTLTKTADNSSVNAGEQIGFTVTLKNTGTGDATGVTLTDTLPSGGGLNWTLDAAGSTIPTGISCAISNTTPQVLSCGTSPATTGTFTLPAGATLKLHVTSPTSSATCAISPVTNTASFGSTNGGSGSKQASVTINCPQLGIVKTADKSTVNAGDQIGFTVTLSNTGSGAATGVTLTDNLPTAPGVTWTLDTAGSSIPAGISCGISGTNPQVLSCGTSPSTTGTFTLAAGASIKLHVTSPTTAATCASSPLHNTATFTSSNGGGNSSSTVTITVNCPNLSITKTADNASVTAGDQIGFTVTLKNTGPGNAYNVTLSDTLPSASGVTWSLDAAGSSIPTGISCAVSTTSPQVLSCGTTPSTTGTFTLPANTTLKLHVTSPTSAATCASSPLHNTATFTSSNGGNGSSSSVTITVNCPNLTINKTADSSSVNAGQQIGFTVTLTNSGAGNATGVTLTDTLPSAGGLTWTLDTAGSSIPAGISCGISNTTPQVLSCGTSPSTTGTFTLPAGSTIKLHITSPTSTATCGATISNTATFTSSNGGTGSSSTVTITVNCAILHVTKTPCPTTAVPGGILTYTITYSNSGAAPATNSVLVDTIPAGTSVADAGGGTVSPDGSTVTWNLGTIAAGGSGTKTLQLLVTAANGSSLTNVVTLSSPDAQTAASSTVVTPVSNAGAVTHGSAYGVDVNALGLHLLNQIGHVATTAPPSPAAAANEIGPVSLPGVVTIDLVRQTSESAVTNQSVSTATSTIVNVDLLNGAIKADAVHGVSQSVATPFTASYNSTGSNFVGLVIQGSKGPVALGTVAPNTSVTVYNPLSPRDKLASVVLYEESGTAGLSNGFWSASHQVNMIHVTLLQPLGTLPAGAEIIVAHAQTDAKYPSGLACGTTPNTVSGKAFTAFANGTLNGNTVVNVQQGDAELPPTGGSNVDSVLGVSIPGLVTTLTGTNTTSGVTSPNPNATSSSLVHSTNLLGGLITADLIDVKSSSSATGTLASTSFGSTCGVDACPSSCSSSSPCFVNLSVNGQSIVGINGGTIKPNTTIAIPQPDGSLILVILNEQIIGGNNTKDTEGTINAIHVYVLRGAAISAEVIVASAHSDAHHS